MKFLILLSLSMMLPVDLDSSHPEILGEQKTNCFDWLTGKWIRTNDASGVRTFENWEKISEQEYRGEGYTLKGNDTVFKENIRLTSETGKWQFIISGVNERPTVFQVSTIEKMGFAAQNLQNEFPKRISYSMEGDRLKALISDDTKHVIFHFKKLDQK